jgi:hypothetical protein
MFDVKNKFKVEYRGFIWNFGVDVIMKLYLNCNLRHGFHLEVPLSANHFP